MMTIVILIYNAALHNTRELCLHFVTLTIIKSEKELSWENDTQNCVLSTQVKDSCLISTTGLELIPHPESWRHSPCPAVDLSPQCDPGTPLGVALCSHSGNEHMSINLSEIDLYLQTKDWA